MNAASGGASEKRDEASFLAALDAVALPQLTGTADDLRSATTDRTPFDIVGWELIARAGQVCEIVVEATGRRPDGSREALKLDEAVNGGLLVRLTKLVRALFDSTQADNSEAHQILARCAAESAVNLRWLLRFGQPEDYKRFRADSFPKLLRILDKANEEHEDPVVRGTAERLTQWITHELRDAGLHRSDVPRQPGRWAGNLRDRFKALGEEGLYDAFFVTHSDYVHGSWHELRTFHLRTVEEGYELDLTYGGLTPSAMYETSRLALSAISEYTDRMPVAPTGCCASWRSRPACARANSSDSNGRTST